MKPLARKAWVNALRSGEYEQERDRLCDAETGGMCCLGVLIDVAADGDWVLDPLTKEYKFDGTATGLSPRLIRQFGLDWATHSILVKMNDTERCTFSQIADWVENNL